MALISTAHTRIRTVLRANTCTSGFLLPDASVSELMPVCSATIRMQIAASDHTQARNAICSAAFAPA